MSLPAVLSVKRTTPNWTVLRERGQEPLQFYWFCTATKLYNSLLSGWLLCDKCDLHDVQDEKHVLFYALA